MAEIVSSKLLDALPKVPASSLEPQFSEAQDLDQAKLEASKPSQDAVYGSVAIAGLGRRHSLSEHSEFDVLRQRFELVLSHDYDASAIGRRIKGSAQG